MPLGVPVLSSTSLVTLTLGSISPAGQTTGGLPIPYVDVGSIDSNGFTFYCFNAGNGDGDISGNTSYYINYSINPGPVP